MTFSDGLLIGMVLGAITGFCFGCAGTRIRRGQLRKALAWEREPTLAEMARHVPIIPFKVASKP